MGQDSATSMTLLF